MSMRWTTAWMLLIACSACWGGFDQTPLEPGPGALEGRFPGGADPEKAWVAVVGEPTLVSAVDASGHFRIEGVPSGTVDLAGIDGEGGALVAPETHVWNGRTTHLEVKVVKAARLEVRVATKSGDHPPVTVRIAGLPVVATGEEKVVFESLPPVCLTLDVERLGYRPAVRSLCPGPGEKVRLDVVLEPVQAEEAGLCAPCRHPTDCETGLCVLSAVDSVSEQVCSRTCTRDEECPSGYECTAPEGEDYTVCLPRRGSCLALEDLKSGRACQSDEACGLPGAEDGVCRAGTCTLECDTDRDCPSSTHCQSRDDGPRTCR